MVINSPLIRRSVVDAVGPFDVTLPPAKDWDYWLRCAAWARAFSSLTCRTLALVRWHSESSSQDRRRMYAAMVAIGEKVKSLTEDVEILSLNQERTISDRETLALETISYGPFTDYVGQMFRTGLFGPALEEPAQVDHLRVCCAFPLAATSQGARHLFTDRVEIKTPCRRHFAPAAGRQ